MPKCVKRPRQVSPEVQQSVFFHLPPEIRFLIYKEILTTDKSIIVYQEWTLLWRRQHLALHTNILRTCKDVYKEAIGVLYGHNTFMYRLRDAAPRVIDVDQVAQLDDLGAAPFAFPDEDDAAQDDDMAGDDDGEYIDDAPATEWSTSNEKQGIMIAKHRHLFRHIEIAAERNRFGPDTKHLMAKAINVFAPQPCCEGATVFIHMLTICVSPDWDAHGGADGTGCFTFVDFFKPDSCIMEAVKSVNCELFNLVLQTNYLDGSLNRTGCKLMMDLRPWRICQHLERNGPEADDWRRDPVMLWQRRRGAKVVWTMLQSLNLHVNKFCERFLRQKSWDQAMWAQYVFED